MLGNDDFRRAGADRQSLTRHPTLEPHAAIFDDLVARLAELAYSRVDMVGRRGELQLPAGAGRIDDFRNGLRHTADPRKPNTPTMINLAKDMTVDEMMQAVGKPMAPPTASAENATSRPGASRSSRSARSRRA